MARRRTELTFSLSFLDVMSVGLGSVILLFLIINHASERRSQQSYAELEQVVGEQQARFVELQHRAAEAGLAVESSEQKLRAARAQIAQLSQQLEQQAPVSNLEQQRAAVSALRNQVQALEQRVQQLRSAQSPTNAVVQRIGDGDRQYLTGLKVNGLRALFLVDASASMLDRTVVGTIRRRNMSDAERRAAPKWQRTVAAVEWLCAQLPPDGQFQIYIFNNDVRPVLPATTSGWLNVDNGKGVQQALTALRQVVPSSGTSLHRAFSAAARLAPRADNIYLLTDGLPTLGALANERGNIGADRRLNLFERALNVLPRAVPVNVVLMPMEGDPLAPSAFWQLSRLTGGVMLAPARDWP